MLAGIALPGLGGLHFGGASSSATSGNVQFAPVTIGGGLGGLSGGSSGGGGSNRVPWFLWIALAVGAFLVWKKFHR